MATTNLTINLGVATGKMASGFRNAKGQINSFTASLKTSMMSGLAPFLGMLGGALSIRAFTSFIQNAQESIDKIAKMSVELGMTTEQVAGYEHAVNLSGVEMEAFAKSIDKMRENILGANRGLKTQVDAFRALGLDAQRMAGLSTDEQFKMIADSVQRLGWSLETASAVADIFGAKVGPKMAAMLMEGSAGIEAAQSEAERLGLTLSGVDAAKVEIANDAMTRLYSWVEGVGRSMAVYLAPTIQAVSELLLTLGYDFENSMNAGKQFADVISMGLRIVLNIADVLYRAFESIRVGINLVLIGLAAIIEKMAAAINYLYETETGRSIEEGLRAFHEALAESVREDVADIGRGTFWGEEYEKNRQEASAAMEREARKIAKEREAFAAVAMPETSGTVAGKTPDVAAVQRGTMEAFKAIADANKTNPVIGLTEKVVANTRAIADALRRDEVRFISIELL